ncbi:GNAT family N-acetyltransferase [Thalassomonas viridans]|uniref:GNAT family N-acetyltransferase n=1 Tax=Thalassomonas viridans TaxID=137584 RepID=A0AAE9Z2G1_9GAMM|nr:GNAT family N-acetyltransferase [Thalassomonas viridans]WDE05017.1 GNAT family N-acetyltransferase [Thalassomonas viridans]
MSEQLSVKFWDQQAFADNRQLWQQLLENSDADPLFMSWQWQYAWWANCVCSKPRLHILAVYRRQQLVALAPLFSHEKRIKKLFTIRQLQFIGCSYDINDAVRSDNLDFIYDRRADGKAIDRVLHQAIQSLSWHTCLIQSACRRSQAFRLLRRFKGTGKLQVLSRTINYIVEFSGDFEHFCKNLKKKVRQKTILHRRFIAQELDFTGLDYQQVPAFIDELNRLKFSRWRKKVYEQQRLKFQQMFTGLCAKNSDIGLLSSTMAMDSQVQSAFYGFSCDNRGYFLQYAFNPGYNTKLSLGFLHLGYVIEQGYRSGLSQLQLLPGGGQSEAYKQYLANKLQPQVTVRIISSGWLRALHWLSGRIAERAKKP